MLSFGFLVNSSAFTLPLMYCSSVSCVQLHKHLVQFLTHEKFMFAVDQGEVELDRLAEDMCVSGWPGKRLGTLFSDSPCRSQGRRESHPPRWDSSKEQGYHK